MTATVYDSASDSEDWNFESDSDAERFCEFCRSEHGRTRCPPRVRVDEEELFRTLSLDNLRIVVGSVVVTSNGIEMTAFTKESLQKQEEIFDTLNAHYKTKTPEPLRTPTKEGRICLVRYEDECYYRAEIKWIYGKTVSILFVDFGEIHDVAFTDLFEFDPNVVDEPKCAAQISIPLPSELTSNQVSDLKYMLLDDVIEKFFKTESFTPGSEYKFHGEIRMVDDVESATFQDLIELMMKETQNAQKRKSSDVYNESPKAKKANKQEDRLVDEFSQLFR